MISFSFTSKLAHLFIAVLFFPSLQASSRARGLGFFGGKEGGGGGGEEKNELLSFPTPSPQNPPKIPNPGRESLLAGYCFFNHPSPL